MLSFTHVRLHPPLFFDSIAFVCKEELASRWELSGDQIGERMGGGGD